MPDVPVTIEAAELFTSLFCLKWIMCKRIVYMLGSYRGTLGVGGPNSGTLMHTT